MSVFKKIIQHPVVRKAIVNYSVALLKEAPSIIYAQIRNAITLRVTVSNMDSSYYWVQYYLANSGFGKNNRNLRLTNTHNLRRNGGLDEDINTNISKKDWYLAPGEGVYRFKREGAWFTVTKFNSGKAGGGPSLEFIQIEVFNGSKEIINNFLEEARNSVRNETATAIHMYNGYWQKVADKAPRNESTLIMSGGKKEKIFEDLQKFYNSRDWYRDRGIPYHRGYLFSGPAGTGKTSMIDAMASKFQKSIATINISSVKDDDELYDAFLTLPRNAIIALEDIDCLTSAHKRTAKEDKANKHGKEQGVTLAGLLNCLDGIVTPDCGVVVMTSNHPEKLDPALVRPGRADVHEVFDYLSQEEQQTFSKLFYEEGIQGVEQRLPAAKLSSIFMDYLDDPESAQKEIERLD